jgi:hypothetical protein
MYKESTAQVAALISDLRAMPKLNDSYFHVYVKDMAANTSQLQQQTNAEKVTKLPNVGREGETFLYHILTQYDTLAQHTMFLQAGVHNRREFSSRIAYYFDSNRTGMLNLGPTGALCSCDNCGDRFGWADTSHLFPLLHERIYRVAACDSVQLSYKGQFIVSAKRIRGISKPIYVELRDAFVNSTSWAHQQAFLDGKENSMSKPYFGYTMERLWNLLFQCSGPEVGWKCPSLLSRWRLGGSIRDCQCLDS